MTRIGLRLSFEWLVFEKRNKSWFRAQFSNSGLLHTNTTSPKLTGAYSLLLITHWFPARFFLFWFHRRQYYLWKHKAHKIYLLCSSKIDSVPSSGPRESGEMENINLQSCYVTVNILHRVTVKAWLAMHIAQCTMLVGCLYWHNNMYSNERKISIIYM